MTQKIYLTPKILETINQVVTENSVARSFVLIGDSSSGIGVDLVMEFDHALNGRIVTVRVDLTDHRDW
jgi:hypothetical protein